MSGPTTSPNPAGAQRFRPDMEQLEAREAPAAIALPDIYNVRSGRTLNQTRVNRNGIAGVLRNDFDDTEGRPPGYSNLGLTSTLISGPVDLATGLPVTTPFTFNSNGGFTFRAPRNFNGLVQFTYTATARDGSVSAVTPVTINVTGPIRRVAVGADAGGAPAVTVYDSSTKMQLFSIMAFDANFHGGVSVATGDFNGDNIDDIVVGAGAGGDPHVKIFNGATGAEMASFLAFDDGFRGGVNVATGDLNNDDVDDLIVSAASGDSPHVKVYDGSSVTTGGFEANSANVLASFLAYGTGTVQGVRTTVGDIDGDGNNKLVVAPSKGSTFVEAYSVDSGVATQTKAFFAGDPSDTRGLFITAGDYNGDFIDDIAVGSGSGFPEARIYAGDSTGGTTMALERTVSAASYSDTFATDSFTTPFVTSAEPDYRVGQLSSPALAPTGFVSTGTAFRPGEFGSVTGGMRVATDYQNRDNYADLVLGEGPNDYARVVILSGQDLGRLVDMSVFGGFFGGVNVAGHY